MTGYGSLYFPDEFKKTWERFQRIAQRASSKMRARVFLFFALLDNLETVIRFTCVLHLDDDHHLARAKVYESNNLSLHHSKLII